MSKLKTVEIATMSSIWRTSVNGDMPNEEIINYFKNNAFDVGAYPEEKMEKPFFVGFVDDDNSDVTYELFSDKIDVKNSNQPIEKDMSEGRLIQYAIRRLEANPHDKIKWRDIFDLENLSIYEAMAIIKDFDEEVDKFDKKNSERTQYKYLKEIDGYVVCASETFMVSPIKDSELYNLYTTEYATFVAQGNNVLFNKNDQGMSKCWFDDYKTIVENFRDLRATNFNLDKLKEKLNQPKTKETEKTYKDGDKELTCSVYEAGVNQKFLETFKNLKSPETGKPFLQEGNFIEIPLNIFMDEADYQGFPDNAKTLIKEALASGAELLHVGKPEDIFTDADAIAALVKEDKSKSQSVVEEL